MRFRLPRGRPGLVACESDGSNRRIRGGFQRPRGRNCNAWRSWRHNRHPPHRSRKGLQSRRAAKHGVRVIQDRPAPDLGCRPIHNNAPPEHTPPFRRKVPLAQGSRDVARRKGRGAAIPSYRC